MKVDVKIAGASYSKVPSILIPLQDGGKARFCEVSDTTAKAADVGKGKKFYTSEGELVVGTANLSQVDTRKKITLIQKEHQTITLTCNHPNLSSETDSNGNTVYATEYQDTLDISLRSDSNHYAGKITINGEIQENPNSNPQIAYVSVPISDGMIVSATDAILIPTISFTDVSLTMMGQGPQMFMGYLFVTIKQSPESPKVAGVVTVGGEERKGVLFLLEGEQRYEGCKVELTTGAGISDTTEFSCDKDTDMGVTMGGKISDELFSYLVESLKTNAEVVLTVKVVG